MLKPIFARAGTSRKESISNEIKGILANTNCRVMVIVPEQSSFETEKELYLTLKDKLYSRVDVFSFTRLCTKIGEKYGKRKGNTLTAAGKLVLSSCAIEKALPKLKIYSSQASNPTFAQKISSVLDEIKTAGITREKFQNAIENLSEEQNLYRKLSDINSIYAEYESLLAEGFIDTSDNLDYAVKQLGSGEFFKDYHIIIDGFVSFNSSQYAIIKKMVENSHNVTVYITNAISEKGIVSVFKTPHETYQKLKLDFKGEISEPVELESGTLYKNSDLKALEEYLVSRKKADKEPQNIKMYSAPNIKKECRFVASEIRKIVNQNGYRYRDIAVIGRDMQTYSDFLEDSFLIYDIPFFSDARASIDSRPIVVFVVNLLEAIINGIDPAFLLRYLKSGISPVDIDDVAILENYIELWKLNSKELKQDFEKNPNGFEGEMNKSSQIKLEKLNNIRKKAVMPLVELSNEIIGATGKEITQKIYLFMKKNGVLKKLSEYTENVSNGDSALGKEQERAFEVCMSAMNQLSILLKTKKVTPKRYLELFRLAVNAEDVGSIPHHLDEVQIGDAVRIRTDNPRVVFLVGANDGIFPKRHEEDGFFNDVDRTRLRQNDMDILAPSDLMNQNEEYYMYSSLSAAGEKLYVSYSLASVSGEGMFPSKIVERIKNLVKDTELKPENISTLPIEQFFQTEKAAFEQLCLMYNSNTEISKSLKEYFSEVLDEENDYHKRFLTIDTNMKLRYSAISEQIAKRLYEDDMCISPTEIEEYFKCSFAHFCKYGLGIKQPKQAEVTGSTTGSAIHEVLELLLKNYTRKQLENLNEDERAKIVEEYLENYVKNKLGNESAVDNRSKYLIMRLKSSVLIVLKFILKELEQSGFEPKDFELQIGIEGDIEPYEMVSPQGNKVKTYGKVDRVDLKKDNNNLLHARIIDYKSYNKKFSLDDVSNGLNLQMLLYLFSIIENGDKRYGQKVIPNSVLYMESVRKDLADDKIKPGKNIEDQVLSNMKMSGLTVDASEENAYISCQDETEAEFSNLKKKIEELVCEMADSLRCGNLEVYPYWKSDDDNACIYCKFKTICGFEKGDRCKKNGGEENGD